MDLLVNFQNCFHSEKEFEWQLFFPRSDNFVGGKRFLLSKPTKLHLERFERFKKTILTMRDFQIILRRRFVLFFKGRLKYFLKKIVVMQCKEKLRKRKLSIFFLFALIELYTKCKNLLI